MNRKNIFAAVVIGAGIAASTIGAQGYATYSKWAAPTITYYINPQNADVSPDAAEAAVQVGASAWHSQSHASFSFFYAGRVSDTATGYDGHNVVLFRNVSNGSTIATTYSWWDASNHLLDSDIIFWDGGFQMFTGTTGCSAGVYIEDIAAHEMGHALGMSHTSVPTATMYPSYSICSVDFRSLDPDDISGVEALYPPSAQTNSAPSVTIVTPANNASMPAGTPVMFSGSASDSQDGNLTSGLVWTSSLDGRIGTGGSFTANLSAGTHTITASVTDSQGLVTTRQESIIVTGACIRGTPTIALSPAQSWTAPGGAVVYTAAVTNRDSTSCGSSTIALRATAPAVPLVSQNWTAQWGKTSLTVTPGATASTTLKVTASSSTQPGSYGIGATAQNVTSGLGSSAGLATEVIVSNLGVIVWPDMSSYTGGQTAYVCADVLAGPSLLPSAKVTITLKRPDGTTLKTWSTTTNGSGMVKVNANLGTAPQVGTYSITAAASKNGIVGSASSTFVVH